MVYAVSKIAISALVITLASELAKRSTFLAALIISLPTISILTFTWVYIESQDKSKIVNLSWETLLLVIPSLVFFVILPVLIKTGINFWCSLGISMGVTAVTYWIYMKLLVWLR